jgi:squalene synthase HpnC
VTPSSLNAATPPIQLLSQLGPDAPGGSPVLSPDQAGRYCRELALSHYENFSVLSRLVPERLRPDFAAVYSFCRWSDDLADETGPTAADRERSLRLLAWWRSGLTRCFSDSPPEPDTHPVYIALRQMRTRHPALSDKPFHDLIDAFVQDQHVTRYASWDQCVDYCTRSANSVGRIVLALGGYGDTPANAERYRLSDATCTALQLINFWQDVRRDLLERDRIYLPLPELGINASDLRAWADRPDDPGVRVPYIRAVRPLVDRTSELFDLGRPLPRMLDRELGPVVWLFGAGGEAILRSVEAIGCATLWQRPSLSPITKGLLLARAMLKRRTGGAGAGPGHG